MKLAHNPVIRDAGPVVFDLTASEADQTVRAVAQVAAATAVVEDLDLDHLTFNGVRLLPERLVDCLHSYKQREPAGAVLVRGWNVDDAAIGPTPAHWRVHRSTSPTLPEEVYLTLVSSLLGDVISWSTVQDGQLVQDLLPVKGEELDKSAGSSASLLELHNEDAFSPFRCDYLGLLCLRNDDRVGTSYAALDHVSLTPRQRRILAEPRFQLMPDPEHLTRAAERGEAPPPPLRTAVLFGNPESPYITLDELFIQVDPDDEEARSALAALLDELRRLQQEIVLAPGDLLIIDNYRAVHGRRPFRARYDGRDRWLKRISVTRDLRRSRAARTSAESRVIQTGLVPPTV
jgi:L-asparagine oxygenase